ncbi:MAG: HEAT repeat domain-containing protein, partial [Spirochaetales bacterium]|nr:HEAT repeat domain-containing protein [Spirochaetales bacterium]
MKNRFFIIIILVSLILPSFTFSQNTGTEKEKTVEELFLQSIELTVIGEMATSLSREAKLDALAAIEDRIESG